MEKRVSELSTVLGVVDGEIRPKVKLHEFLDLIDCNGNPPTYNEYIAWCERKRIEPNVNIWEWLHSLKGVRHESRS